MGTEALLGVAKTPRGFGTGTCHWRSAEILLEEGRTQEVKSNCFLKCNFSAPSPSPLLCTLFLGAVVDASVPWASVGLSAKRKVKALSLWQSTHHLLPVSYRLSSVSVWSLSRGLLIPPELEGCPFGFWSIPILFCNGNLFFHVTRLTSDIWPGQRRLQVGRKASDYEKYQYKEVGTDDLSSGEDHRSQSAEGPRHPQSKQAGSGQHTIVVALSMIQ